METKAGNGHNVNLERLLQDLKTVLKDGEELLKTSVEQVKERAISSAKSTDRIIRDRPYQSIGIVFGLGVLVGLVAASVFISRED